MKLIHFEVASENDLGFSCFKRRVNLRMIPRSLCVIVRMSFDTERFICSTRLQIACGPLT